MHQLLESLPTPIIPIRSDETDRIIRTARRLPWQPLQTVITSRYCLMAPSSTSLSLSISVVEVLPSPLVLLLSSYRYSLLLCPSLQSMNCSVTDVTDRLPTFTTSNTSSSISWTLPSLSSSSLLVEKGTGTGVLVLETMFVVEQRLIRRHYLPADASRGILLVDI